MQSSHLSTSLLSWRYLSSTQNGDQELGSVSTPNSAECSLGSVTPNQMTAYKDYMSLRQICDTVLINDFLNESIYFELVIQAYDPNLHEPPHGSKAILLSQLVPVRHLLGSQNLHSVEFVVPPAYPNAHQMRRNVSQTLWGNFKMKYRGHVETLSILPKKKENMKELVSQYDVWFENENKALPLSVVFRNDKTVENVSFQLDMEKFPMTLAALQRKDLNERRYIMSDNISSASLAMEPMRKRAKISF